MHYWDEFSKESQEKGIPDLLTSKSITIKHKASSITYDPNPLYQYTFQADIAKGETNTFAYHKQMGETTVRYPFSGVAGTKAEEYNK